MPVKIKSSGGGSVTIDVPSTAVDTTMILPTNNASLVSNTNPVMTGNVAVSGANSYISVNGDNVSLYTMKNRIINGDFNIWQRGTSFVVINSVNTYSADRFRTEGYTANTTISQQSFTGGQTAVPDNPTYYCTVALNNTNTNGYWAFMQRIESPQVMRGYGTYTLSFWARATSGTVAAGGWYYGIQNVVSGPALTTTWQKITQTVTISSSAAESSGYVSVYLVYLTQNTAALSIDIAHVQVESGSITTPFEWRPYGLELNLCKRYYWQIVSGTSTEILINGYNYQSNQWETVVQYPVEMRSVPLITFTAANTFLHRISQVSPSTLSYYYTDTTWARNQILLYAIFSGLTQGQGSAIGNVNTKVAGIYFSAEL
jgi:hypothetical protein